MGSASEYIVAVVKSLNKGYTIRTNKISAIYKFFKLYAFILLTSTFVTTDKLLFHQNSFSSSVTGSEEE